MQRSQFIILLTINVLILVLGLNIIKSGFQPAFAQEEEPYIPNFLDGSLWWSDNVHQVGIGTSDPTLGRGPFTANQRTLSILGDGSTINARGFIQLGRDITSHDIEVGQRIGTIDFVLNCSDSQPHCQRNGLAATWDVQVCKETDTSYGTCHYWYVMDDYEWRNPMTIHHSGYVGIGTMNPQYPLSIAGDLGFHGNAAIRTYMGDLNLAPASDLLLQGKLVAYGDPDSCGAGYRCVMVEN